MISNQRRHILLTAAASAIAPWSNAQSVYPSKPIRYIVPVAAGGGADMIARATCERLAKLLGQSLVVENVSGGGGAIASQNVARSNPDGYTLLHLMWPPTAPHPPPENCHTTRSKISRPLA